MGRATQHGYSGVAFQVTPRFYDCPFSCSSKLVSPNPGIMSVSSRVRGHKAKGKRHLGFF